MKKSTLFLFLCVFIFGIVLRLYKLTSPIADWHSWRQSDTAAVERNFEKFGFDPLRPRYDDLSNIASGKDNPMGWRMVEFPLYQSVAYMGRQIVPMLSSKIWLRLVTIAASAATAVVIGLLAGFLPALVFAILPYSIYYGRTILPDPLMVFLAVLSVYLLYKKHLLSSAVLAVLALLVKPTAVFLLLPIPYLLYQKFSLSKKFFICLFAYLLICLLPILVWRHWIFQFSEGIPAFTWLFNAGNIRFKGAWFNWIFAERIGKLILGYWGLIPFGLGLVLPTTKKESWLFRLLLLGSLAYVVVLAAGNVQHDYYQILLLPVMSIYVGKGFAFLWKNNFFSTLASRLLLITCLLFTIAFSWFTIRTYYWINRPEIVEAGKVADALLPKDAKVIASYNGDTTFLYQINRQGWPLGFDIPKKLKMGATHYVTVSPTDADYETMGLSREFTVLVRNDKFAIIDLTRPRQQ
ncbi:hypothetical protein HY086_02305 [Candidatus Gottesmanbacteria bacterium]|nr:hypothetical protein [Candidatus Gottesmanbacteria bacterium]